ncbi:hypothetical protein A1O3_07776 [Capronia epimyces CBS 606.96]|uniref:Eisosome protein 1 n=1 Tax=Capronia epimyces CBS 606.96 TaxID=1182542 RepID=W9XMQ4_9EURO|nr:uncharacterized protein A1O3_07776 [Capronia epimyces CBS 606.96]EXJ81483.1 hypothetical protein A1O3_07776 [Capronia epimyces CBS 606.96]
MSALTATATPGSAYHPPDKLKDQAASAALYSTQETPSKQSSTSVLDDDGRLSSASAALSLKYARADELPSYPSTGGVKLASAGAAASLADSNKKQFEHWKPGPSHAANQAAYRAKDYELDAAWKPELSQAGSQAAMAAHKDSAPVDVWTAPETEHGASAASSAHHNQKSPPAITERQVSTDGRQKALLAATMSMSRGRRRAESAPIKPLTPSPAAGSAGWALKAAESSHRRKPSDPPPRVTSDSPSFNAARVQNMAQNNISRQMYTSNPPVAIEVEERNRQDTLRASALAMARKMYAIQQSQIDEAKGVHRSDSHFAAYTARRRAQSDAANSVQDEPAPRYENLEEAARKLAHERLAKLHDEHAEYRQYYGQQTPPRTRVTLRRGRRTSSLQEDSDSDEEQSRKIRAQMSLFQGKLADVDNKKRQADRDALLAIAHKNVTARMNALDEKMFSETGKTTPQQREIWERQARERAQRESDERLIHAGKVHIGGGKYLEQSEIDEIAKARVQPTLDEITEKAEQQRARDAEIRLEQERLKAEQATEKQRQAEVKTEQKAAADREKAEAKAQKAEERRAQHEQKVAEKRAREEARADREEKKQPGGVKPRLLPSFLSRGHPAVGAADEATVGIAPAAATVATVGEEPIGGTVHDAVTLDPGEAAHAVAAGDEEGATTRKDPTEETPAAEAHSGAIDDTPAPLYSGDDQPQEPASPTAPTSPSKRDSRVKSWFRKIRGGSKAEHDFTDKPELAETQQDLHAANATAEPVKVTDEDDKPRSESVRDVALAGRGDDETEDMYDASPRPESRIPQIQDGPVAPGVAVAGPGPAVVEGGHKAGSTSFRSDSSELSEEPYVIAADVASSRYSAEPGSKRDSGADQLGTLSDTDSEPRGRKGFRERFLKKVIPGSHSHKDKQKPTTDGTAAAGSIVPISENPAQSEGEPPNEAHANPDLGVLSETEPLREKLQDPSTAESTTTGATTPALTQAQTNDNDDDEDFEEARDTFDEQRLGTPPKLVDVAAAKTETPRLIEVGSPLNKKLSTSPAGSRGSHNTGGREGSRFTEEL